MVRHEHEGVLKVLWLLAALLFWAAPASANVLVFGAVRDQDGRAVRGALVVARDAAGAQVGSDRTAADGTFAVDATAQPSSVAIDGAYLAPLRLPVVPAHPVVAIVHRYGAVADRVPTAADLAALPDGALGALASAIPFVVDEDGTLSDRGLAGGHGGVAVDGIAFYRRSDGTDVSSLVPRHATGALAIDDPLDAPRYGDRAAGGVIDADTIGGADAARAFGDEASLRVGRTLAGTVANDRSGDRARALAAVRFDDGTLRADWVTLRGDAGRADGMALQTQQASRTYNVFERLVVEAQSTTPSASAFVANGSSLAFDAALRTNAAAPWEFGVRTRAERGASGATAGTSDESALYVAVDRATGVDALRFELAAERDLEAVDGESLRQLAMLPSLTYDRRLATRWDLRLGIGTSMRPPTYLALTTEAPESRSALDEAAIAFDDRRRVRIELAAWRERSSTVLVNTLAGVGLDAAWQIAPRLSLRGWTLADDGTAQATSPYASGYATQFPNAAASRRLRTGFVWLSWTAPTRIDLVDRAGHLEGAVRTPLTRNLAASLATYHRQYGSRVIDLGLVFAP